MNWFLFYLGIVILVLSFIIPGFVNPLRNLKEKLTPTIEPIENRPRQWQVFIKNKNGEIISCESYLADYFQINYISREVMLKNRDGKLIARWPNDNIYLMASETPPNTIIQGTGIHNAYKSEDLWEIKIAPEPPNGLPVSH